MLRIFRMAGQAVLPGLFCLLVAFVPAPALAQFTIEIGISRDKAVRAMVSRGYTQIDVVRKGFKTVQAQACLDGTRYLVRVDDDYRVRNLNRIGACRRTVTMQSLEQNLKNSGFTRIVMEQQNAGFVALACNGNQRVRITYSLQGEVLQQRSIGRCEEIFEPNDIRPILRQAGYNRIKFTDRQLPWYRAEACKDGRRYELLLTRRGDIRRRDRVGNCSGELAPGRIADFLKDKGYDRVEVIDNRLPRYVAAACLKGQRVEVGLNRWGEITGTRETGRCPDRLNRNQIAELLESEGFSHVRVSKRADGRFDVSACLNGVAKFAVLSRYGELVSERDGGRCEERKLSEILETLEGRGFSDLTFSAEGCRNGRKVRVYFDRNGDRIRRERTGNC